MGKRNCGSIPSLWPPTQLSLSQGSARLLLLTRDACEPSCHFRAYAAAVQGMQSPLDRELAADYPSYLLPRLGTRCNRVNHAGWLPS